LIYFHDAWLHLLIDDSFGFVAMLLGGKFLHGDCRGKLEADRRKLRQHYN